MNQRNSWNPYKERKGRGKLTPQQRYQIGVRLAAGEKPRDLAQEYGVTTRTVENYRRD